MARQRYPLGLQSFREVRTRGCVYVDKTDLVFRLTDTDKYYFLSRPRRFGKSLLVSTLEEYFLGHRELFDGLAISELDPGEWPEHPVLHFDFSRSTYEKAGNLDAVINEMLAENEIKYGTNPTQKSFAQRFGGLIDRAYEQTGRQVVVLIDEYDLPIVNCLDDKALEEEHRIILKGFYGVMKSQDAKLRFVLLTGVGKLGHLSVFSGLNNLRDISLDNEYATICGISEEELHQYFDEGVGELARKNGWTAEEAYAMLKRQYDGYHFARNLKDVYNPFSLLYCLTRGVISDYWFQSGTPSHLLEVLRKTDADLRTLDGSRITESSLMAADVIQEKPVPFMFYTGYLTIKGYDREFNDYTLGYPNQEVENSFIRQLLPVIAPVSDEERDNFVKSGVRMLRDGRLDDFMEAMKVFFASMPYELSEKSNKERFYQNVMYCVCKLMGYYVEAEYRTSRGRIDMVVGTATTVYVMEFKLDGTAEEAIAQIDDRNYTLPFALDGRRVVRVGAAFSSVSRTLDHWIIKE